MNRMKLDHINIRTSRLDALTDFYVRVLGFEVGFRPSFPFPGAWLYSGDIATVHLIGVSDEPDAYSETQQLEHFAFSASGMNELVKHLRAEKVPYWLRIVPDIDVCQINLHDSDGNHLHIDFAPDDRADDMSDYAGD